VLFLCGVKPVRARGGAHRRDAAARGADRGGTAAARRRAAERRASPALAPGRLYVYGRGGEPCRRCGETVRRAYQGLMRRSTYWCPRCQPAEVEPQPPPVPA
jgi:formamidopyrimidine-DNA glycosylase